MKSLNLFVFDGNLGRDPEMNFTPNGLAVTNINVACTIYDRKSKSEKPLWIRVTMFGQQGEFINAHAKKGTRVVVSGEMNVAEFTRRDGSLGWSVEVVADKCMIRSSSNGDNRINDKVNVPDIPDVIDGSPF